MKGLSAAAMGLLLLCSPSLLAQTAKPASPAQAQLADFFETKVRPVLAEHCFSCHGPKKHQAGLRLDSKVAAFKGGDEGPVIVPGHPEKSPLIKAIRHEGAVKMPPKGKLPSRMIEDLTTWVKLGAVWPATKSAASPTSGDDDWVTAPPKPRLRHR